MFEIGFGIVLLEKMPFMMLNDWQHNIGYCHLCI